MNGDKIRVQCWGDSVWHHRMNKLRVRPGRFSLIRSGQAREGREDRGGSKTKKLRIQLSGKAQFRFRLAFNVFRPPPAIRAASQNASQVNRDEAENPQ